MILDELIKTLDEMRGHFPGHTEVVILKTETEFDLSPVEAVKVKKINWSEDPGGPVLAREECIIISDEL